VGLFTRLLQLHTGVTPFEDFFTEIVGHLLNTSPDLLYAWLEYLSLVDTSQYTDARVSTQQTFSPVQSQSSASRFDILVELSDGCHTDVIIFESKMGSSETPGQLKRYARVLSNLPDVRERILVYITRNFDPKKEKAILKNLPGSAARFRQVRWYTFYQFLRSQSRNALIDEILTFMKETGMAQRNQFTPVDMLALANFSDALNLMDATMWGKASTRFEEVLGKRPRRTGAFDQLRRHQRYLLNAYLPDGLWCGLGYWMRNLGIGGYPTLGIDLEIDPKSKSRQDVVAAMKEIREERGGWEGYNLDTLQAWSGISRIRSLQDFLSQQDQVAQIEEHFVALLDELAEIKQQYPHLPWTADG
jgi:hypothetical protein